MSSADDYSLQELARGQNKISEQLAQLHIEITTGHSRLRHDVANLQVKSAANFERISAHGRELGAVNSDVSELRADNKRLLWAVIGAYGAILLAVMVALLGKVF